MASTRKTITISSSAQDLKKASKKAGKKQTLEIAKEVAITETYEDELEEMLNEIEEERAENQAPKEKHPELTETEDEVTGGKLLVLFSHCLCSRSQPP